MGPDHLHHLAFEDCRFSLVQEPNAPSPETLAFSVPRLFKFLVNVRGGKFTREVFAAWLEAA